MKTKPDLWLSLKSGKTYDYYVYANHGHGGIHMGKLDLPKDEYPYTIIYEEYKQPFYMDEKRWKLELTELNLPQGTYDEIMAIK